MLSRGGVVGLVSAPELAYSWAGDDHLVDLAVQACGFSLGEFFRPGDPLAVRAKFRSLSSSVHS